MLYFDKWFLFEFVFKTYLTNAYKIKPCFVKTINKLKSVEMKIKYIHLQVGKYDVYVRTFYKNINKK